MSSIGGGAGGGGPIKDDLLQQADQLWSMMDELCQDDPDAYQRFIQKHMKEGREVLSEPPHVESCVRTDILVGGSRGVGLGELTTQGPKVEGGPAKSLKLKVCFYLDLVT